MYLRQYYKTHEGGVPYDGECTSEPELMGVTSFLAESSFGEVKNCWDNKNYKSVIIEKSQTCPNNTFEQNMPGLP